MSTVEILAEHRVLLRSVGWRTFVALAEEAETLGSRLTYDKGMLEIMSPMMQHETAKRLIGRMIERYTELRGIDILSSASTTFRREDMERGFEADESYYILHARMVRMKREVDLSIDPPPDLVLEIDMTHSSIDKLKLFAAFSIPEVWRYDGKVLWLGQLEGSGYIPIDESDVLQGFPLSLCQELLTQQYILSETEIIKCFVEGIV